MIVAISKDNKDIISHQQIKYSLIEGYLYDIPISYEVGIMETGINESAFSIGGEYRIFTVFGTEIEVMLSEIDPFRVDADGENYTSYIFLDPITYKLSKSEMPPTAKVWGIGLDRHIIGNTNQLKIALLELRRKGLINAIGQDFSVVQKHCKEYQTQEAKYITGIQSVKKYQGDSRRKNYSSIEEGKYAMTNTGIDRPIFVPTATEKEISALSIKIEPKMIIKSDDANYGIQLGETVKYSQVSYCVMERQEYSSKDKSVTLFTLGELPDEN